jgi:putative colanic acid biosynthesis UDP-glucose lipid carrier transferase
MEKTNTGNQKNKGNIYSPLYIRYNSIIKRAFDLMVSIVMLCSFFPIICLIVGIFIKLTSPGPIFFVQKRTGKDGKDFNCYKFRSMVVNQDADKIQATANDPRKTPLGNFIRNTSIDEIPQLINVFLGDMSLIGPRPHMVKHTEMYSKLIDNYMDRHAVKPGITGWAQVTGLRGETKELSQMENRVKADIWYIQNWSFLLDMKILIKTILTILLGDKNAY